MSNEADIISGEKHNQREVEALVQLAVDLDLHDSWRSLNPECKQCTWCRHHPFTARRLDYILTSNNLTPNTVHSEILTFAHSDHRAVLTTMSFHDYQRGPSYWKFNNSLLKDKAYVSVINNIIEESSRDETKLSPHTKWELCKIRIREQSIAYSKHKRQKQKDNIKIMQTKLQLLENELAAPQADNERLISEIIRVKTDLEINALAEARGAQIRSRIKFIEEGEKNTRYFLGLEKANGSKNTISALKTEDGKLLTKQQDVLKEQVNFYAKLYKKTTLFIQTKMTRLCPIFLALTVLCLH